MSDIAANIHTWAADARLSSVIELVELLATAIRNGGEEQPHTRPMAEAARVAIEDTRMKNHYTLSVTVLDANHGVTEDVMYFVAVCLCDRFLRDHCAAECPCESWYNAPPGDIVGCGGCALDPNTPVCDYTIADIDTAYAALFLHRRRIDWPSPEARDMLGALQWRAEEFVAIDALGAHTNDDEVTQRRVEWSCTTARFKLAVADAVWLASRVPTPAIEQHAVESDESEDEQEHEVPTDSVAPPGTVCSGPDILRWLGQTVAAWDGPRLREAVGAASRKRDVRPGEAGRCVAFNGQTTLHRSRGGLDSTEAALHVVSFGAILATQAEHMVGATEALAELLAIKLFDNVLECHGMDFLRNHVALDSMRDGWHNAVFGRNSCGVHRVVESYGGWFNVDTSGACTGPKPVFEVLAGWYAATFPSSDPLGIHTQGAIRASEGV
jgi:hypothetical protein